MKQIVLFCMLAVPVYATKFLSVEISQDTIQVGKRIEVAFEMSRTYDNPFNPTEAAIDAVITAPSGQRFLVPAFWYQAFQRSLNGDEEVLTPAGPAGWRVRFMPTESGRHSLYLQVKDIEGTNQSDLLHFTVHEGESRGFIRVDVRNPRWLSFDDGSFYFPMGQNVAWATNRGTFDYDDWMTPIAADGENWMRVWMTHFYRGQSLEWNASHWSGWYHGLGRYSLQGAWKLDSIIEQAEKLGIYIQLVTQHHGQFSQTVNPNWDDNPYNVANGGFLYSGDEFFTHEQAKELYKRKMRYTIARWGYSPAILAWELFNEVQYTDNYAQNYPNVAAWHQEMAAYIHQIDPWRHLVTTSARDEDALIWSAPDIDLTQIHYYGAGVNEALRQRHLMMIQYGKPNIIGEFGDNSTTGGSDSTGTVIHQALWATSMVGGGAMPWWWDNYIHPHKLYYHWYGLSAFWRGEDLRVRDFRPVGLQVEGGPQTVQGVRVSPGRGWEASTRKEFEVQPDGTVPGIGELSQFLQGSDKAAMGREAIFHTRFAQEIGFAVAVGGVSSWQPGRLQIFLDDNKTPLVSETPQPPQRFEIRVPAGEHRVRVFNAGVDWLTIDYFEFSGLPISAATGYALSNGETAYVWIYDRDYHAGASPHAVLGGVIVTLPQLAGEFEVEQWNTLTGERIGTFKVSDKRSIAIPLADFTVDTALKLRKTGTAVRRESRPVSFLLHPPSPNPFNASTTLCYELKQSEHVRIAVFNLLGEEVETLLDARLDAGSHRLSWSAEGLTSGVYWIKFTVAGQVQLVKAALIK